LEEYLAFSFFTLLRKIETNLKYQIKLIAVIVAGAFVFLGARQSLGVAPIGPSGAYYSKNPANNSASLNSGWNFIYQCFLPIDYLNLNDYNFFGAKDKDQLAKSYFVKSDSIPLKLEQKPNLVLIVLESFNAYLSQHYGGRMNHTPFFDSLSRSGISFTNCYSGTNRTDKALACINSGFPGTPWNSILNEPQKAVKLPQLSNLFKESGYTTSFSYGGDLSFANMRTYLDAGGFDDILDLDYVRTAKAKGLSFRKVVWKHAFPNAINPLVTSVGGWLSSLLAGAFFTEYIFNWKGLGKIGIEALQQSDLPVIMGTVLFTAGVFLLSIYLRSIFTFA